MADFPIFLDDFPDPADATAMDGNVDPDLDHANQHQNANDAIEALEAKVGIDTSPDTTSLDAMVKRLSFPEDVPRPLDDSVAFYDASELAMRQTTIDSLFDRAASWRVNEEFTGPTFQGVTTQASGTGAAIVGIAGSADHPGVVQGSTGTTTTGRVGLHGESSAFLFGEGRLAFTSIVRLTALSDGTDIYTFRSGFGDSASAAPTDAVLFRYTHSENSGNWVCATRSNGSETVANTDVPVVAGAWYRLNININAAGNVATFHIGALGAAPALVATIATNIPVGVGRETGVLPFNAIKAGGTNARTFDIDYYYARGEVTEVCVPGAPLGIEDLRLWLKTDSLALSELDAVTTWGDGSEYAFDFTQATAGKKPLYKDAIVNGKPVTRGDGTDDLLMRAAADISAGSAGSIFIVAQRSSTGEEVLFASSDEATTNHALYVGKNASEQFFVAQNDGGTEDRVRSSTTLTIDTPYILEVTSTGTAYELRQNGAPQTLVVSTGANSGDWFAETSARDNFTIGALKHTSETSFWTGDIAEVIVYDHALTDIERSSVEFYLSGRYGIAL